MINLIDVSDVSKEDRAVLSDMIGAARNGLKFVPDHLDWTERSRKVELFCRDLEAALNGPPPAASAVVSVPPVAPLTPAVAVAK